MPDKKISKGHGINLFLFELIAVLLFFSISGAVVINMFAAANYKASKSMMNEKMILCAQSVSELFSVSGEMSDITDKLFGGNASADGDGSCTVYMDRNFNAIIDDSPAAVILVMKETDDIKDSGVYKKLYYEFVNSGEVAFSGSCSAYIPDFGGAI